MVKDVEEVLIYWEKLINLLGMNPIKLAKVNLIFEDLIYFFQG